MTVGCVYNQGRFPVPPKFDFRVLPLRGRKVTVVSIIGDYDILLGESQFVNIFSYIGKKFPLHGIPRNYVEGYYDCDNQVIFLIFNHLQLESLFRGYENRSQTSERTTKLLDYTLLKVLYFLLIVSHFIVITCIGTNLSPDFIRIFKLLDKIRIRMCSSVDNYIRDLPLPREWLNNGRASVPRLLFVFKLRPAQLRMMKDWKMVKRLEPKIVTQIFNTFYETGLISTIPANHLFMLPGHNFVHVLYDNECTNGETNRGIYCDDLAQHYFEFIMNNVSDISSLSVDKIPNLTGSSTLFSSSSEQQEQEQQYDPRDLFSPPSPWNYPGPDQPTDHSLHSFLRLHVSNMFDQAMNRNPSYGYTSPAYELPTCKAWFMACYRIYTSLMSDDHLITAPNSGMTSGQSNSTSYTTGGKGTTIAGISLSQSWHNTLTSILCPTLTTSTLTVAQKQTQQKSVIDEEEDLLASNYSNPWSITDPINRFAAVRYRTAISAAETHYKQDLPVHYSYTYHMIKVVSAYNVVIGLIRGHSVFRLLEKLANRLTYLYVAGRVVCPALSLTGQTCQHEFHRVPDDLNTLQTILSTIDEKSKEDIAAFNDDANYSHQHQYGSNSTTNQLTGIDLKAKEEYIIPSGLSRKWKRYWLECAIKDLANTSRHKKVLNNEKTSGNTNPGQHLAVMPHRSNTVTISSCSCGRQQAERLDPFDYKEANWRFYHILSNVCCNKLGSIPLSPQILSDPHHIFCLPNELNDEDHSPCTTENTVFNPLDEKSICILTKPKDSSPSSSSLTHKSEQEEESKSTIHGDNNNNNDNVVGFSQPEDNDLLLLSAESNHSDSSDETINRKSSDSEDCRHNEYTDAIDNLSGSDLSQNDTAMCNPELPAKETKVKGVIKVLSKEDEKKGVSSHSSAESKENLTASIQAPIETEGSSSVNPVTLYPAVFRDGVPNTNWLVGDIPRYPSWSIYTLGKYYSYSHSSGLPCRGFLRNSNFLLPWDVSLTNNTWNAPERGRFNKPGRGRRGGRPDSDTVKLFIGFEMECSMGHRFFITGIDRVMDGPMPSSQVRRAVHLLLTRDLPIFMPCECQHSTTSHMFGDTRHPATTNEWDIEYTSTLRSSSYTNNQTVMAQLSRIYLAIPSAPIRVRVQPCVRPGPPKHTPIFHLGHTMDQCSDKRFDSLSDFEYEQNYGFDDDCYIYEDCAKQDVKYHGTSQSERYQAPGYVTLDNGYLWVIRLPYPYIRLFCEICLEF
uniref:Nonsense-mediated mRNA decay factor SMG8 n=1 Tax=Trichobilharzia regenti TaxID=157069 RepID=A0AA85K775_TRIRE|nr:unnamed protein product [Trichobilharzia regenti]